MTGRKRASAAHRDVWLAHLNRLLSVHPEHDSLTAEEARAIALEIGLTEADLATAAETAQKALARGRGYAARALWDEAIAELTEAVTLAPTELTIHHQLASAYLGRYASEGAESDRKAAIGLAKLCLGLDPHHAPSFALIARAKARSSRRPLLRYVAVAGFGAVAIAALAQIGGKRAPVPAASATAAQSSAPTRSAESATSQAEPCAPEMRFDHDRGCFRPSVVILPGKGFSKVAVGTSTAEDVLRELGADAKVSRHPDGRVFSVDYAYDADGQYAPSRRANHKRPGNFSFDRRGVLSRISVGVYQQEIVTPGGLHTNSTKSDMLRELGDRYDLVPGDPLEKYVYRELGIEVWIQKQTGRVNSFHIRAPGE